MAALRLFRRLGESLERKHFLASLEPRDAECAPQMWDRPLELTTCGAVAHWPCAAQRVSSRWCLGLIPNFCMIPHPLRAVAARLPGRRLRRRGSETGSLETGSSTSDAPTRGGSARAAVTVINATANSATIALNAAAATADFQPRASGCNRGLRHRRCIRYGRKTHAPFQPKLRAGQ